MSKIKKLMKSQKGSISMFVIVSVLFLTFVLVGIYASYANKLKAQEEQLGKIKDNYGEYASDEGMEDLYIAQTQLEEDNGETTILPSEYQQVEYIQSTGTQYIDTGVAQNEISEISGEFQFTNFGNSHQGICGRYTSDSTSINIVYNYNSGNLVYRWGANNYNVSADLDKHTFIINSQSLAIDNTIVSTYSSELPLDTDTLVMFARRIDNSGTTVTNHAHLRLYKFEIKSNGITVRDFIPCYRKADNVIGMYDIVNDVFYTNSGSGTFTKGNNV